MNLTLADSAGPGAGTVALTVVAVLVLAAMMFVPLVHRLRRERRRATVGRTPPTDSTHPGGNPHAAPGTDHRPRLEPDEGRPATTGPGAGTDTGDEADAGRRREAR
ncbi:hypothetical protein [Yinghuangia seranimata]|uniref:hypothetical protein n=1 Tax=Yinghuangia seranimata TaxID=408067 RepID=UPI00248B4506|nr:hypothetical protein [Yinghuangia seranimata]MDI2125490.1 hypothetical protein [Yinghuangia seranimata]